MKKILLFFIWAISFQTHSASFDCSKAKSNLEKFICGNQTIDELDKKMGDAFKEARKTTTLSGYITADQKYWLKYEYSTCGTRTDKSINQLVEICSIILNKRIADLNLMKISEIYTNYDGSYDDGEDQGTIQILENSGKFRIKYQGNKFSTLDHVSFCWGELEVKKNGAKFFEQNEKTVLLLKNKDSVELLQSIPCDGPTGGMPAQKFKLR